MKKKTKKVPFAVCLDNKGYPVSLEIGKLCRIVPDVEASAHGYFRVIDESGDDYAFSAERFHIIKLPLVVGKVFSISPKSALIRRLAASQRRARALRSR